MLRKLRRRLPGGLLGMLAIVAAVEAFVARHGPVFTSVWDHEWHVAARDARKRAPEQDILIFGDSLAKNGILPRTFQVRLGRPAYSLAVCGGTAASSYFLLRRALEAGARPEAVVVDFEPCLQARDPADLLRRWPELTGFRDVLDLYRATGDARLLGAVGLARLLPSVRCRAEIRGNILATLRGECNTAAVLQHFASMMRNWRFNRGAFLWPARCNPVNVDGWYAETYPKPWEVHPANRDFARKFLDLAAAHDVRVFLVLMPARPLVQAKYEQSGLDRRYLRFIRRLQAEHPEVTVVDARRSSTSELYFIDVAHLHWRGAAALTEELAAVVGERLGDPPAPGDERWVALPAISRVPADVPMEDLNMSTTAVLARERTRR